MYRRRLIPRPRIILLPDRLGLSLEAPAILKPPPTNRHIPVPIRLPGVIAPILEPPQTAPRYVDEQNISTFAKLDYLLLVELRIPNKQTETAIRRLVERLVQRENPSYVAYPVVRALQRQRVELPHAHPARVVRLFEPVEPHRAAADPPVAQTASRGLADVHAPPARVGPVEGLCPLPYRQLLDGQVGDIGHGPEPWRE